MINFKLWGSLQVKGGMQARYGAFVAGRFMVTKPHQSAVLFLSRFSALITLIFDLSS